MSSLRVSQSLHRVVKEVATLFLQTTRKCDCYNWIIIARLIQLLPALSDSLLL